MVDHDGKLIQLGRGKFPPPFANHLPRFAQNRCPVTDLAQQTFRFLYTHGHDIRPLGGILVCLQAD